MRLSLTFFFFLSCLTWADSGRKVLNGFDPATDIISEKYEAGAYLIYDCVEKHWVCVGEVNFKECEENRREDFQNKSPELSCAPIGQFPGKKACFQRQLYLSTHHHGTRFCIHDDYKKLQIKFSQF